MNLHFMEREHRSITARTTEKNLTLPLRELFRGSVSEWRSAIVRQFLMKGLGVVGYACVCGLVLSSASTRVLSRMLYGVSPSDPITLTGVTAIVLVVAMIASLLPALRASRFGPPAPFAG